MTHKKRENAGYDRLPFPPSQQWLDFKQLYRGVNIDLIFRENQRRPLEGRDRQLFQRAHFAGLRF